MSRLNALDGRLGTASILGCVMAVGCSSASSSPGVSGTADLTSTTAQPITQPLANTPTIADGVVTITLQGETAEIYVNAADSSLMVNDQQVSTSGTVAYAAGSKANVKSIAIRDTGVAVDGGAVGNGDVVILNYLNGFFGQGTTTAVGTTISLQTSVTNSLVIKGGPSGNYFAFGANGITLNNASTTKIKDITTTNVSAFAVYLGDGNDKFTAAGNSAIGGAFASAVSVYGGPGNDTLVEGTVETPNETWSGGTGTDTVDYSARTALISVAVDPLGVITSGEGPNSNGDPTMGATEGDKILDTEVILGGSAGNYMMGALSGTTTLTGGTGNDTFCQGDNSYRNGTDKMTGGGGVDTVDYSHRTNSLSITMDGATKSGDPTGNSGAGEADIIGDDIANVNWGGSSSATDTVTGNALANTFTPSSAGTSHVFGLAGNDTLAEGTSFVGNEIFSGGAGVDTVDYSGRTNNLTVVMDGVTHSGESGEADVIDTDVENLYGGAGDDSLTGNANDNDIEGNAGNDTLVGLAGSDTLVGAQAAGSSEANVLYGNDVANTFEANLNLCINIGTGTGAAPSSAGSNNCTVAQP